MCGREQELSPKTEHSPASVSMASSSGSGTRELTSVKVCIAVGDDDGNAGTSKAHVRVNRVRRFKMDLQASDEVAVGLLHNLFHQVCATVCQSLSPSVCHCVFARDSRGLCFLCAIILLCARVWWQSVALVSVSSCALRPLGLRRGVSGVSCATS